MKCARRGTTFMSSPERPDARRATGKTAAKKKASAPKAVVKAKIAAAPKPVSSAAQPSEASRNALALASTIETALRNGDLDVVSENAQQALTAALMKLYGANSEAGNR